MGPPPIPVPATRSCASAGCLGSNGGDLNTCVDVARACCNCADDSALPMVPVVCTSAMPVCFLASTPPLLTSLAPPSEPAPCVPPLGPTLPTPPVAPAPLPGS